ncbi:predicted protein [Plenodomus lingam JN3]|uniref:Predicted protein n=1 Tax=Leptosphaeria maculans (strain JN3 / isolate v23.1.3 / race Av1-4-5-6-7-8) TaxID=985895 RepID=E5A314_LEPMJ|nr:predicted protein [Plenodomus lingam JN3]CBX98027.1 predicted protein [Plenodomus lingam JN3]
MLLVDHVTMVPYRYTAYFIPSEFWHRDFCNVANTVLGALRNVMEKTWSCQTTK